MDDVVGLRLSLGGASVSPNREPEGGPPADLGGGVAREAEAQATAEADRSIDRSIDVRRVVTNRRWTTLDPAWRWTAMRGKSSSSPVCTGTRRSWRAQPHRAATARSGGARKRGECPGERTTTVPGWQRVEGYRGAHTGPYAWVPPNIRPSVLGHSSSRSGASTESTAATGCRLESASIGS